MSENYQPKTSKNGKPLGRPSYASQGKPKKSDTQRVYKIVVPNGDASVLEWMELQDDPSVSIRLLVKDYISRKGFQDIACMPAEYSPVGRKPKDVGRTEYDKEEDEQETEVRATLPQNEKKTPARGEDEDDMAAVFIR